MGDAITAYLAGEADGAIPNGAWVIKQNSEPGDGHRDGTEGRVVSSLATPDDLRDELRSRGLVEDYFYFIDWGEGVPVGTIGSKVKENK